MLKVEDLGHQAAVGGRHEPPQLAAQLHVPHAGGDQDLLELPAHALADEGDVVGLLLRAVGHADAAGEVDIAGKDGHQVMDTPGDAKYGMTRPQIAQAFRLLKAKGAKTFGIHAFLASNTISNEYYPELAGILFRLAAELKEETGCHIRYINLSGGIGVPYRPEEEANDSCRTWRRRGCP